MSRRARRGGPPGASRRRGLSSIEFALVLPLLLLGTAGIVDFARWFWVQTTLDYAVQAAARCAAVNPSLCIPTTAEYAASQAYALSIPADEAGKIFSYENPYVCGTTQSDPPVAVTGARVTANYPFHFALFPLPWIFGGSAPGGGGIWSGTMTLTATACYPT